MTDSFVIKIPSIKIYGYHGCYRQEKSKGQEFDMSIKISLLRSKSLRSTDNLNTTIDYVEIVNIVKNEFNLSKYNLLEELAIKISDVINSFYEKKNINTNVILENISVRIRKFNPIGMDVPYIEVEYNSNEK